MAKNKKKTSNAAARNKAMLQEKLFKNALGMDLQNAYNKGLGNGYGIAVLVMFWLLHTEHSFGKKRLAIFMRKINDFCLEYIGPGEDGQQQPKEGEFSGISLKDIAEQLAEECGIYIDTDTWTMEVEGLTVEKKEPTHGQSE